MVNKDEYIIVYIVYTMSTKSKPKVFLAITLEVVQLSIKYCTRH